MTSTSSSSYFEQPVPEPSAKQDAQDKADEQVKEKRFNFGYEGVDRLRGNLGYIDLHQFARPEKTAERIGAAMTLLGDTSALIVDLRHCDGGDPETVMLFASYLFDKPTHLNDIYFRDENRTETRWDHRHRSGKEVRPVAPGLCADERRHVLRLRRPRLRPQVQPSRHPDRRSHRRRRPPGQAAPSGCALQVVRAVGTRDQSGELTPTGKTGASCRM